MSIEPIPSKPKTEQRREIQYGTPGVVVYRNGMPVLWIPDNFGSITKNLARKDLEALWKEAQRYLGCYCRDDATR